MIAVVDDTVFREHFDFGGAVVLRLNLEQLSVTLVLGGIHTIDLLHRDFLTIDKVIGFTILHTSLGYELELENVVAPIDGVLNRNTVDKVLFHSGGNDTGIVVDVERTDSGNTSYQITSLGLGFSALLHFDIIVYVLLCNTDNCVFLKLKSSPRLPLVTNLVQLRQILPVALDHDTVRIELDNLQVGYVSVEVLCQFHEEKLSCDTHRASHKGVKQVVVLVE